jgi:hypothetical protein
VCKIGLKKHMFNLIFSLLNSSVPGGWARWLFGTISGVLTLADIGTSFISEDTIQANFRKKIIQDTLESKKVTYRAV